MSWRGALVMLVGLIPGSLTAHEFWIEPESYRVMPGDMMVASLRVGQDFSGYSQSFLPRNFERFDLRCDGALSAVPGRAGDRPALSVQVPDEGLCVVIHQTGNSTVTYREWQKFLNFVEHKAFENAVEDHVARELSQTDFLERYSRYAKSLIAVGNGQGADSIVGLTTEIVAQANPYTDDLSGGMPVQVFYNNEPRTNAQVELFAKSPDDSVNITLHRTDVDGLVTLPVQAGYSYLVDAVVLRPVTPQEDGDPVWESLWASLTFAVPE